MKKIILSLLVTGMVILPCKAQEVRVSLAPVKNAVVATGKTTWRVIKLPFAISGLLVREVVNGEPFRTVKQGWILTE